MDTKEAEALQAELIMGGASSGAAILQADPPARAERTPRRRIASPATTNNSVDLAMTVFAYLGVLAIAAVLWYWGARFTLTFLSGLAPAILALGLLAWLIPAVITAVELKLWPHVTSPIARWVVFLGILLFDLGSSFAGFTTWAAGRTIPLFTGITFPTTGWGLWLPGVGLGMLFAFGPERLTRYAIGELNALRSTARK
jgi:hypothetical protein